MSSCDVFPHVAYLTSMGRPVVLVTEVVGDRVERSVISDGILVVGRADHLKFYEEAMRAGKLEVVQGDRRIYAEVVGRLPRLIVVGSGPVAAILSRLARDMGMPVVHLSEDPARSGDEAAVGLEKLDEAISEGVYVVVANEGGSPYDIDAVEKAIRGRAGRVWLMASERRAKDAAEELTRRGLPREELAERLYAPAGLDLGAQGAGEIALSILAEVLLAWRGGSGRRMRELKGPFASGLQEAKL